MALCSQVKSTDQRLEAMQWYFGARHCRTITFVNDVSGSLDGEWFDLNVIDYGYVEKKYAVLLSNGTTTTIAGLPSGVTEIVVDYDDDDTAATIAGLVETALSAIEARTLLEGNVLEVQNWFVSPITIESYANAGSLTMVVGKLGFGGYLGQTDPVDMTTTVASVVLTDDAQGETQLDEIITGYTIELPLPIKEMTTARWEDLIGKVTGNTVTIGGKDITGFGTKKIFQSLFQFSGRLVGHPFRNEADNIDEDIVLLNTAPKFDSINFSGADIQIANFNFSAYKEANAVSEINLMARGDHSKF
jgi:hypothetical protein